MSSKSANLAGGEVDFAEGVAQGEVGGDQSSTMASHFEADADVDTDVSKAKPTRKKSASKAVGAEEKPKTPRKRTPKKQANSTADIEGDHNDSTEGGGETTKPTPKKRGPKSKKVEVEGENGDADVEDGVEPSTPKAIPVKKRTPKAKKESADGNGPSTSSSSKKRASPGGAVENEDGTPSKKPRATPSKAVASKLPTNRSELKEEDKLMLEMKKAGKTWAEITTAYSGITGLQYGKSTLAVRYAKIIDALTEWKSGDVERMLFAKEMVEKENAEKITAFQKKVESETWAEVAKGMANLGADVYTGGAVEKAYTKEKRDGFPHHSTIATVMAGFSSAGGVNGGDGSDAEGEAGEVEGVKGLKIEGEEMDSSADADASEV